MRKEYQKDTLRVETDSKMPNLYLVKVIGGGVTPISLQGRWTKKVAAEKAVQHYYDNPTHADMVYAHPKTPSPEELKVMEEEVERITDERNAKIAEERNDGEESRKKTEDSSGAERLHQGSDNGSQSAHIS